MENLQIHLHQTRQVIGSFQHCIHHFQSVVSPILENKPSEQVSLNHLHVFPELFLGQYQSMDLYFDPNFQQSYNKTLTKLKDFFRTFYQKSAAHQHSFFMGALEYEGQKVFNSVLQIMWSHDQLVFEFIYRKHQLPQYDIFDEKHYFTPGTIQPMPTFMIGKHKVGLLVCEDLWSEVVIKPQSLKNLSVVITLNASPFHVNKLQQRIARMQLLNSQLGAPMIYLNCVGFHDEIAFDGQSFVMEDQKVIKQLASFAPDYQVYTINDSSTSKLAISKDITIAQHPRLQSESPAVELTSSHAHEMTQALTYCFQEFCQYIGAKKFLIGLSGGIDSGLVATLVKLSLRPDQSMELIYLPSQFSSSLSLSLAQQLAANLNTPLKHFPIKFLHSSVSREFQTYMKEPLSGISDENIQSRLRGMILMARSNQTGAMVVNTSNRSELAVGYSTLYGDSVGAISLIGDLYKTEVLKLSQYINHQYPDLIPADMISRPPTAELRENQKDTDSLPPYDELDQLLHLIHTRKTSNHPEFLKIKKMVYSAQFKRQQFCPIIKIKSHSYGRGYRMPITMQTHDFLI